MTDSNIYKCNTCQKEFSTYSNLKRHTDNIHDKIKQYKCEFCDFCAAQKPNLKKHSCYMKLSTPQIDTNENLTSHYSIEYAIQTKLEKELKGRTKVCPFGRIDILTDTEIIEIKKWEDHKKAIGQIMGYGIYYPKLNKRIHFFGPKPTEKQMSSILEVCETLKIKITEE